MEINIFSTAAERPVLRREGRGDAPLQSFRKDCLGLFFVLAA